MGLEDLVVAAARVTSENPVVQDLVKERTLVPVVEAEADPAACRPTEAATRSADEARRGAGAAVSVAAACAEAQHGRLAAEAVVAWAEEDVAAADVVVAVAGGNNH